MARNGRRIRAARPSSAKNAHRSCRGATRPNALHPAPPAHPTALAPSQQQADGGGEPGPLPLLQLPNPATGAAQQFVLLPGFGGLAEVNRVRQEHSAWLVGDRLLAGAAWRCGAGAHDSAWKHWVADHPRLHL